jgi:uncharacterized protein YjbI with pentapeptide repeats
MKATELSNTAKSEAITEATNLSDAAREAAIMKATELSNAAKTEAITEATNLSDAAREAAIMEATELSNAAKTEAITEATNLSDAAREAAIMKATELSNTAKSEAITEATNLSDAAREAAIMEATELSNTAKTEAITEATNLSDAAREAAIAKATELSNSSKLQAVNESKDYVDSQLNDVQVVLETMKPDDAGNIGVGVANPQAKLDVNGDIRATEIRVEANGNTADFVFDENYVLKDLKEVEKFILENKHLPDIPSAKEMEASGVNLAEMNKLLLQKIEELTLYVISLQKEKDSLRAELEARSNWQKELDILKREIIRIKNRSNL